MAPSPYLLRILTRPTTVDEATWQRWYINEHLPDLIKSGARTRGALLRAHNEFTLQTKTTSAGGETKLHNAQLSHFDELPDDKTFCAVYQCEDEDPMLSEKLKEVPTSSSTLPGDGSMHPCAEWDLRVYKLIQNYDPDDLGDIISPFCLHVQNEPADEQDYHNFYEHEHLDMLHKVPGYRKSQRYELITKVQGTPPDVPKFMVVHEFDHLDALDGPELREADASPNTHRVFGNAKAVNVRGFKVAASEGYSNSKA